MALVLAVVLDLVLFALIMGCSGDDNGGTGGPPSGPLNSGNFSSGSYVFRFTAGGSFNYECTNHLGMHGNITVDVNSPNTDSALVTAGGASNTFTPVNQTVRPNGYIRWINAGGVHNVTSH
jgi:plastocyanin